MVSARASSPSLLGGQGAGPIAIFLAGLALIGLSLFAFRARHNELFAAATTDPLTGLGNRRALTAELETALDRPPAGGPLALIIYDLDGGRSRWR